MLLSATWDLASLSAKKVGGGVCLDCRDGLEVLTWGWTWRCHCQTSVDMPHHHCRLPLTCRLLTWRSCIVRMVYRRVQVVVSGWWRWCGDDGWASWVVVVVEEGGCCLLTCLLTPKLSIGKRRCSIWMVAMVHRIY